MNAGVVLLAAAVVTWCARVLFIAVLRVEELPPAVRSALADVGPAALAALAVTSFIGALATGPAAPVVLATAAAAGVAWWRGDLTATIVVGVAVNALLTAMS